MTVANDRVYRRSLLHDRHITNQTRAYMLYARDCGPSRRAPNKKAPCTCNMCRRLVAQNYTLSHDRIFTKVRVLVKVLNGQHRKLGAKLTSETDGFLHLAIDTTKMAAFKSAMTGRRLPERAITSCARVVGFA